MITMLTNTTPANQATSYCRVCKALHPSTDFYTYGGTSAHADHIRTYCKEAQKQMTKAGRQRRRGVYGLGTAGLFTGLVG